MAETIKGLGKLASDSRSRTIMVLTGIVLLVAITVGLVVFRSHTALEGGRTQVAKVPAGIQSIPGSTDTTPQYIKLQTAQNVEQAKQAEKTGGSAIPTIIGQNVLGEGVGQQPQADGAGFATLAQQEKGGHEKGLWLTNLKQSDCSAQGIDQAKKNGISLEEMRKICSCAKLHDAGYNLSQLKPVCNCPDLKPLGFSAVQLNRVGFSIGDLRRCGFSACVLKDEGLSATDLKDAGFSDAELQGAGYTPKALAAASGLPDGISGEDVHNAGCSVEVLRRERADGVRASAIRRYAGCCVDLLKTAGYQASELEKAGYTAGELNTAGYSLSELKKAGYPALPLKDAGFKPSQLKGVGFTARQLAAIGFSTTDLREGGFSPAQIVTAALELPPGISAQEVRRAGCNTPALQKAHEEGITAATVKRLARCGADALKAAGYAAGELKAAEFTPEEILKAGFSPEVVKTLFARTPQEKALAVLRETGCNVDEIRKARELGVTASTMRHDIGCCAVTLRAAGYTAKELKNAGFTAAELKKAGFSAKELKDAGFSAKELKDAGFSAKQLAAAGFSAKELKDAGFSDDELRAAGVLKPEPEEEPKEKPPAPPPPLPPALGGPADQPDQTSTEQARQLERVLEQQAKQIGDQKFQQALQQAEGRMAASASQIVNSWKVSPTQTFEAGDEPKPGKDTADAKSGSGAGGTGEAGQAGKEGAAAMIKAGHIMFAVIDTAVNTDEPGPVLATVVEGPFKGARLIGSIQVPANAKKAILQFKQMSIPSAPKTISINAFAIDPDTARTALSSKTDSHYLMRYGSLFAASFMQGIGQSVADEGKVVKTSDSSTEVTKPELNFGEHILVGLGKVGQTLGTQIAPFFSRPPTIYIYSGTGVGVLFASDVAPIS